MAGRVLVLSENIPVARGRRKAEEKTLERRSFHRQALGWMPGRWDHPDKKVCWYPSAGCQLVDSSALHRQSTPSIKAQIRFSIIRANILRRAILMLHKRRGVSETLRRRVPKSLEIELQKPLYPPHKLQYQQKPSVLRERRGWVESRREEVLEGGLGGFARARDRCSRAEGEDNLTESEIPHWNISIFKVLLQCNLSQTKGEEFSCPWNRYHGRRQTKPMAAGGEQQSVVQHWARGDTQLRNEEGGESCRHLREKDRDGGYDLLGE